jgi:glycosyltransferase involved in cell wall biosynthesis
VRVLVVATASPNERQDGFGTHLQGLLPALARLHDVHLICHGRTVEVDGVAADVLPPVEPAARPRELAWRLASVPTGVPGLVRRYERGPLTAALTQIDLRERFDVAHVTGAGVAWSGRLLRDLPRVLVQIDAYGLSQRELALSATGFSKLTQLLASSVWSRYERRLLPDYDASVVSSSRDRDALIAAVPSARVEVVHNGVDTAALVPDPSVQPAPGTLVFHGSMDYAPNVDAVEFFVRDVLPLIRNVRPDARLRVVGRNPAPAVLATAGPAVEVTGAVSELGPALASAEVAVMPLRRGTGIKNKVLEAAALGLPIVATTEALGDIDLVDGAEVIVANDARAFADAVLLLLRDVRRRTELGCAARAAVADRWTWESAARRLTEIYAGVAGRR